MIDIDAFHFSDMSLFTFISHFSRVLFPRAISHLFRVPKAHTLCLSAAATCTKRGEDEIFIVTRCY